MEDAFYANNTPALRGMLDVIEASTATATCEIEGKGLDASTSDDMRILIYGISPYDTERWAQLWIPATSMFDTVPYETALSSMATTALHGKLEMFVMSNTADRLFANGTTSIPEDDFTEAIGEAKDAAVPRSFLTRRYEAKHIDGDEKELEIRFSKIIGSAAVAREVAVELTDGDIVESLRITELSEQINSKPGHRNQQLHVRHSVERTFDSIFAGVEGISITSNYDTLLQDVKAYWQLLLGKTSDTDAGVDSSIEEDISALREEMLENVTNPKDAAELTRMLTTLEELRETEVAFRQMFPDAHLPSNDTLQRFMAYINRIASWK